MRIFSKLVSLISAATLALLAPVAAQQPEKTPVNSETQEAWLGVFVTPLPAALRAQLKVGKGGGLLVEEIVSGSPAESAGLEPFDILISFDDQMLFNGDQLRALIANAGPEVDVAFKVVRGGETIEISTRLGAREAKKNWSNTWDELDVEENIREMLRSITENPEIKSALSEAEGEIAELVRSISESMPTEAELKENIAAALKALREKGAVLKDIEIVGEDDVEIEIEKDDKVMRRSRILSDATEVSYSDRHGKIKVSTTENAKTVRITDSDEKVIYEGPLTEKAIQSLDRRDRERLENLLKVHDIDVG